MPSRNQRGVSLVCFAYQLPNGNWGIGWGHRGDIEPKDKLLGEFETKRQAEHAVRIHNKAFAVINYEG
jgi:GH24 family phage-related lysozyme (muramidase)